MLKALHERHKLLTCENARLADTREPVRTAGAPSFQSVAGRRCSMSASQVYGHQYLRKDLFMTESRQQRRARERAEAKAATRPGPNRAPAMPAAAGQPLVVEADLDRFEMDANDPSDVAWSAEWGLRGDDVGIEDHSDDLQELVDSFLEECQQWITDDDLQIVWNLGGDRPEGRTIEDEIANAGITLPARLSKVDLPR